MELINSLVTEGGLVHCRRVAVSFAVYLGLMFLFLYIPTVQLVWFYRIMGVSQYMTPVYWYFIPEVQIPIELLLGHVFFLSVLEMRKDVIGHIQHHVLVFLSAQLGLTRLLIPLSQIRTTSSSSSSSNVSNIVYYCFYTVYHVYIYIILV